MEQTDFEPKISTARKLAAALDVPVEWLVFGIEPSAAKIERNANDHDDHDRLAR
jgi:hypothetical protein